MLLSSDEEMRDLGKVVLEKLPKIEDNWSKILLYANAGYCGHAKLIFYQEKRTVKNFTKLLDMFEKYGYIDQVSYMLEDIDRNYRSIKKLSNVLKDNITLEEFLKNTKAVSTRKSYWSIKR